MNPVDLEQAIQRLLDGDATLEEAKALQEILKHDPAARQVYLSYVQLHQGLTYQLSSSPSVHRWILQTPSKASQASKLSKAWSRRPFRRRLREAGEQELPAARALNGWQILSIAASVVLLLGLLGNYLWTHRTIPPMVAIQSSPYTLYRVEHVAGSKAAANVLEPGSKVQLEQGALELQLIGGTKAIVQGPARFVMENKTTVRMESGTARFVVSKEDTGFRVLLPSLEVTDLGTEFGVVSDSLAGTQVHVFTGTVLAKNPQRPDSEVKLTAGDARMLDEIGRLVTIPAKSARFSRDLPKSLPSLEIDFEEVAGTHIKVKGHDMDASDIVADLMPMENPPRLAEGRGGKVLSLTGHGGMVRTNWPGIAGDAPRTVSFWTKVEPGADLSQLPAIVSWGQPEIFCGKWKLMLFQQAAGQPAYPRISFGAIAFDATLPVNDGRWHHCVMTFTGKMKTDGTPEVSIHVDGQKQQLTFRTYDPTNEMSSFQPDTITGEGAQPFTIGRFLTDGPARTFIGQIDDVRVYAGVLPEDILLKQAQEKE